MNVLLLLDLVKQLVNEHILLDIEVKDFAELAKEVCSHITVPGGESGRRVIEKLLGSKNKDLRQHLDDLASDPILMPGEGEHAMSVNVFCSDAIETKELVFVRMKTPIMAFMDSVVAAQYCLFCFGPVAQEAACIAEGCAFAAVMSDYNLEVVIKDAIDADDVHMGFAEHIEDLVVLPHVHMHSSIRKQQPGSPGTPGTPTKKKQKESESSRNRADAEDVLEEILELCIQDFDHAEEEQRAGHDIHEETHLHEHEDGEHVTFTDEGHTESFVEMFSVDTDGPYAGVRRTIARWHNALQQDCKSDPAIARALARADAIARSPSGRQSLARSRSSGQIARQSSSGHMARTRSSSSVIRTRSSTKSSSAFEAISAVPEDAPVEWGHPHLPHESAPLMAEAVQRLGDDACISLDIEATDVEMMYKAAASKLRGLLEARGLTRAVGELGVKKLLSFFYAGGKLEEVPQGGFSTPVVMAEDQSGHIRSSSLRQSSFKRSESYARKVRASDGEEARTRAKMKEAEESALFMETDHGGSGTWHEESMEVLCIHSAVLPPGTDLCILLRLKEAVEQDLGPGFPSIRWLYVCLGAYYPDDVTNNEGRARAVSLFFSSDDVYDLCDKAQTSKEVLDSMNSFMKHACIVPRARPLTRLRQISLSAASMAHDRLVAAEKLWANIKNMNKKKDDNFIKGQLQKKVEKELKLGQAMTHSSPLTRLRATIQKYSLPLLVGVVSALIFSNIAPEDYEYVTGSNHHGNYLELTPGFELMKHPVTIHFVVNDIFMVFFFGLAAKEITEALLPGGALSPVKKALSPLLATLGGVVGPVVVYIVCAVVFYELGSFSHMTCDDDDDGNHDDHRRQLGSSGDDGNGDGYECEDVDLGMVLHGWGVPTATDISLAWMVSVLVFGLGHNAIGFLLLLAVVDDGIGLIIIAVFYPNPDNPVQGQWLPLIPVGMLVAYTLRQMKVEKWQWYVALAGPISWFGFLLSHVHPALALVPIVPFLPAQHLHHGSSDPSGGPPNSRINPEDEDIGFARLTGEDKLGGGMLGEYGAPAVADSDGDVELAGEEKSSDLVISTTDGKKSTGAHHRCRHKKHLHPALHQFEHDLKLFVDCGMFFFAFANAGVKLSTPGGLTISIIMALVVGKTLGIAGFAIVGDMMGKCWDALLTSCTTRMPYEIKHCGMTLLPTTANTGVKLPVGVTYSDVFMVAFIASMGLTVALFVAGEAFTNPELKDQAKMGALLSGLVGPSALVINKYFRSKRGSYKGYAEEFDRHINRHTEEIDENVVREGLVRILKKRHAEYEAMEKTKRGSNGLVSHGMPHAIT